MIAIKFKNSGATCDKVSEPTTSPSWCWLYQTKSQDKLTCLIKLLYHKLFIFQNKKREAWIRLLSSLS